MKMNKSKKIDRGLAEINLTSLVDVCLTLVIIFMVSYPLVMQSALKIATPSLKKAKKTIHETELKAEIFLKQDGNIELNGNIIEAECFTDSLTSLLAMSKDKLVIVCAENEVLHDDVIKLLDEAKQCGANKLSIVKKHP